MIVVPTNYHIWLYGSARINVESDLVQPDEFEQLPALFTYLHTMMKMFNGMGIAAPQVGIFKQYALVEKMDGTIIDIVNPEITRMYGREIEEYEGCLSMPPGGNVCLVPRQEFINIDYGTRRSRFKISATLGGRDARVVQHEIDHLTGTFFVDRASRVAKEKVLKAFYTHQKERKQRAEDYSRSLTLTTA